MKFNLLPDQRLGFFNWLFTHAEGARTEDFARMGKQYDGSSDIYSFDGFGRSASVVRNITYELIETEIESRIPIPYVRARKKTALSERNSRAIVNLLKNVRDQLSFESFNDEDERMTYIYGSSVYFVEWLGKPNGVKVNLLSPSQLYPQPGVCNIDDMDYFFLKFVYTNAQLAEKYGIDVEDKNLLDEVDVFVCFFKNEGEIAEYVFTEHEEISLLLNYYARRKLDCKADCSLAVCPTHCLDERVVLEDEFTLSYNVDTGSKVVPMATPMIIDGVIQEETVFDEASSAFKNLPILAPTTIKYFKPTCYPIVLRKNISKTRSFFGQSDCDAIFDQQQEINKLESRIMEKLLKGGVMPYSAETTDVVLTDQVYSEGIKLKNTNEKNLLGVLDLQASISQDALQSDRLYQQAKRILGISDSYQGMADETAVSGTAKQLQISQSGGRLESKRIMKNFAYSALDNIIFQFYLAFADYSVPIYNEQEGEGTMYSFNPFDFVEMDENGVWAFKGDYLFSTDGISDIELDKSIMWSEIRNNFAQGVYGDPNSDEARGVFWRVMQACRYPSSLMA